MAQISILGCGWLGFPLALSLKQKGFVVHGSTTSHSKLETLREAGIHPFLINLREDKVEGNIHWFLKGSDVLVLDIPPKMRGDSSRSFSEKIKVLIPFIEASTVKRVLFVSSTSVFGDHQGHVDEETEPIPDAASGEELLKSETLLAHNPHFKTTILRFGGLTGPDRHPVKYLAGRKDLPGAHAPVNLIHRVDCIGIVEEIINQNRWGETFHGVHPDHPLKKTYYIQKAIALGLEPPQFIIDKRPGHKIVESIKLSERLNYQFKMRL